MLLLVASTVLSAGMEPSGTIMTAAGLLGASFTSELPSIMAGLLYPADSLLPRMPGLQRQASLPLPPLPALLQPDQRLGLARQLSLPTVLAGHAAAAAGTSATGPASDLPVDATTRKRPGRPKVPRVDPATLATEEERRLQERKQRNRDAAAASRHVPGMLPPHSRSRHWKCLLDENVSSIDIPGLSGISAALTSSQAAPPGAPVCPGAQGGCAGGREPRAEGQAGCSRGRQRRNGTSRWQRPRCPAGVDGAASDLPCT